MKKSHTASHSFPAFSVCKHRIPRIVPHSIPTLSHPYRLTDSSLSAKEISQLKGTGRNGMLTKGDVLYALGKIKDARGTAGKLVPVVMGAPGAKKDAEVGRKTTPVRVARLLTPP